MCSGTISSSFGYLRSKLSDDTPTMEPSYQRLTFYNVIWGSEPNKSQKRTAIGTDSFRSMDFLFLLRNQAFFKNSSLLIPQSLRITPSRPTLISFMGTVT